MLISNIKYKIIITYFLALTSVILPSIAQDNGTFYKFPITESGVYKINESQLISLGFSGINEVSVFGFPGMLPQKLDSTQTNLQSIPTQIKEKELFFYLEGPHQIQIQNNKPEYHHHIYSDTLFYLIGEKFNDHKIGINQSEAIEQPLENGLLFQVFAQKWEETNLLGSGRNWYSKPIFTGERLQFVQQIPSESLNPINLTLKLMSQALSAATFRINVNSQEIDQLSIASIPNTTYGIKGREEIFTKSLNITGNANFSLLFQSADINATGYLDYAIISVPFNSLALKKGIYFQLEEQQVNAFSPENTVWNVSDPFQVFEIEGQATLKSGEKIAVFSPEEVPTISDFRILGNSIRKFDSSPELIIITNDLLRSQAERLSAHKTNLGISNQVVSLKDIYDHFGYGTTDITAIRNFLAFHYQKDHRLKNVLMFGKGTYDYKGKLGGRPNLIPIYSSRNSLNPLTTYSSDDYLGFLDWGQGEWVESNAGDEQLMIGVGRIPAINLVESEEMVNKIISYETGINNSGDWKRNLAFFADDGDNNIHLRDAEAHAAFLSENHPEFLIKKLYLDRYEQVRTGSSQSSPVAKEAMLNAIKDGVLFMNYIGHGNETTLTAERVFSVSDLNDWPENPLLPLFVTATCEFGRHDSPLIRSAAEELLFAQRKGAIGMLTTGRPVFSSINFALNKAFIETVFQKPNGELMDLGTIFKITKNNSLNGPFNRNFSLLGDPSMKLAVPELETKAESLIDLQLEMETDTLKAMQQIQLLGKVKDPLTGAVIGNSTGNFEVQITDKPKKVKSLGDESEPFEFLEEQNLLFKGVGNIQEGSFVSDIFIPKNIDYSLGTGTIRIFGQIDNGTEEAMGAVRIPIGGSSLFQNSDVEGPKIQMLYSDELVAAPSKFPSPTLPLRILLEDESGMNISSQNIGQDIILLVNDQNPIVLNQNYIAIENGFQKGIINTIIKNLREGTNNITLIAWDNLGNRSEVSESIEIKGSLQLKILSHTTYPNPTTVQSKFQVTHNRVTENLIMEIEVYSILGSTIFKSTKRYVEADFLLDDFEWIFFRSKTYYPVKGTYIYKLVLTSEKDGSSDSKSGKIIIK
ncbi:Peptidase family C25 [Aquiflexum balticum DSM 16537]|uniref:Peptidase family C25 n=1 Tax=Aquiflexum balticum DSM 16537 TaxID=758820 RepID=A0A1W2H497_9BACT|nr:type IX secretion system sortase PorU [Aquiflexum balticum]SMD43767.1 Peptidase family C25 [Aquiflexum balticum DSM 16537]